MTRLDRAKSFGQRAAHELAVLAARFAAGEAELISTYFNWDRRSRETDIHWLTKQVGREIESAFTAFKGIQKHLEGDPSRVDRKWVEEELFRAKQEMNHGNLYADILESLTGERIDTMEVVRLYNRWNPDSSLPNTREYVKLAALFRVQEERSEPWARLVTSGGLLEGGSCGLFYAAALLKGKGNDLDEQLASANEIVLRDERGHGPANLLEISELITTEEALQEAKEMLQKRGEQRLRSRNEQFSHPLSEEQIAEIARGKVDVSVVKEVWGDNLYSFVER